MLIPPAAKADPISRIAFASDFNKEEHDLESLSLLIAWAQPFRAEILLTHIHDDEDFSPKFTKWIKGFIAQISRKTNYSHISHRVFRGQGHKSGLLWLSEHGMMICSHYNIVPIHFLIAYLGEVKVTRVVVSYLSRFLCFRHGDYLNERFELCY